MQFYFKNNNNFLKLRVEYKSIFSLFLLTFHMQADDINDGIYSFYV